MIEDPIIQLWKSKNPLCPEGRMYLADRGLSIPEALKKGICSKDGIIYFIYTLNGIPVRYKVRSMTDKKYQFMSKILSGDESTFKMPFFCQFKCPTSEDLFITEGEFDSVAISSLGASNAVSLPNGCGSVESAFRNNYEFLQQFKTIYICFDMDKPGQDAARKAMSMISPSKYRRICFPEPCKDANDWVRDNPEIEESDLKILMENAERLENPIMTDPYSFTENYYAPIDMGLSTGWDKLDEILGGVRLGEITVVSAETGSGKSTFCLNLMKNIADQNQGVWINSYEMNPIMTHRKIASVVLRKQMKFEEFSAQDICRFKDYMSKKRYFINTSNSKVDIQGLRKSFEMASLGYGVKYVLLDHLDYIHGNGKKGTTLENIDEAMREIHSMALEFNVGVILVVHPKQTEIGKEITSSDLKGSAAIKQYADNIIIVTRMDRIDPNSKNRVQVRVWKNRMIGREGSFHLMYDPITDSYSELDLNIERRARIQF